MRFGDYRLEIVPDTEFRLDGGAMFGVVPRNLWARICPPDDQNRIRMNMNCLYVEAGEEKILIDTGIGEKWSNKQLSLYGIQRERSLTESLRSIAGVGPDDITIVVNTHLHFDHAGGNTEIAESKEPAPTFKKARYFISSEELNHAEYPTERDRASYLPENWRPLKENGQLQTKSGNYEVVPGLRMETHPGHNRSMQCWRLDRGGQTIFGFADLVPMRAHLQLPWIMSYDLYPLETLAAKKDLLPRAFREQWLCFFYHDPDAPLCRLAEAGGKFSAVPVE